jgi:hypothetical protein
MKAAALLTFSLFVSLICAQPKPFRENGKWGIRENGAAIVAPVYDTVFNFDPSGRLCMACHKNKTATSSKFIKITTSSYSCHYLNKKNERLTLRNRAGDTTTVFSLVKNSVQQYMSGEEIFTVTTRGKKFLVDKNFRQYTFRGYRDIALSDDPLFYVTQTENEAETVLTGLINTKEEQVIPYRYTSIRINPADSLIIGCTAGLGNSGDDIYNYKGERLATYNRHVEQATKAFIIHKIFEPSEYYIIYKIESKEEKKLVADEMQLSSGSEIKIRIKNEWFLYDMSTGQKKPLKQS